MCVVKIFLGIKHSFFVRWCHYYIERFWFASFRVDCIFMLLIVLFIAIRFSVCFNMILLCFIFVILLHLFVRSDEHTSELQYSFVIVFCFLHFYLLRILFSFPTRRSSDLWHQAFFFCQMVSLLH